MKETIFSKEDINMFKIKEWITNTVGNAGLSILKSKSPIIKEVLENPENLKIEAYIKGEEIVVTIKKGES